MRILLTGASGMIGQAILCRARQAGHHVIALSRRRESDRFLQAQGAEILRGDLRYPQAWIDVAPSVDAVIHVAATFDEDMAEVDHGFVQALIAETQKLLSPLRVIYTGGVWLYGDTSGQVVAEGAAFRPIPRFAWMVDHAALLAECKQITEAIIHPANVYHTKGGAFARILASIAACTEVEIWGNETTRWPLIHRDDLAKLYLFLAKNHALTGHFNAVTEEGISQGEIIDILSPHKAKPTARRVLDREHVISTYGAWAEGPMLDQRARSYRVDPTRIYGSDIKTFKGGGMRASH